MYLKKRVNKASGHFRTQRSGRAAGEESIKSTKERWLVSYLGSKESGGSCIGAKRRQCFKKVVNASALLL